MTTTINPIPSDAVGMPRKATQYYIMYRDMGPNRSIDRVADMLGCSSTNVSRMSARHNWVQRVADWDRTQDVAKQQGQLQALVRASERTVLLSAEQVTTVGAQCIELARKAIAHYIDPQTGDLIKAIPARDIPGLVRAGMDCLQLAMSTANQERGALTADDWDHALQLASPDERLTILKALKAAQAMKTAHRT